MTGDEIAAVVREGAVAKRDGSPCPYNRADPQYLLWLAGWTTPSAFSGGGSPDRG